MKKKSVYSLIRKVLSNPPHKERLYSRDEIPDPREMGFEESIGEPVGQLEDARHPTSDGRSIHSRTYEKLIGFHWDTVHPDTLENCIEHLRCDSPFLYTVLCTAGGAGLGVVISNSLNRKDLLNKSLITGGILGFLFGLATAEWE